MSRCTCVDLYFYTDYSLLHGQLRIACDGLIETLGRVTFGGAIKHPMTAHPKIDPLTGKIVMGVSHLHGQLWSLSWDSFVLSLHPVICLKHTMHFGVWSLGAESVTPKSKCVLFRRALLYRVHAGRGCAMCVVFRA